MNKSKRMAALKHRRRRKKLEERKKAIAIAAGHGTVAVEPVAKPAAEATKAEAVLPRKPVRKKKTEAVTVEAVSAEPMTKAIQPETPKEAKKRAPRKKAETADS